MFPVKTHTFNNISILTECFSKRTLIWLIGDSCNAKFTGYQNKHIRKYITRGIPQKLEFTSNEEFWLRHASYSLQDGRSGCRNFLVDMLSYSMLEYTSCFTEEGHCCNLTHKIMFWLCMIRQSGDHLLIKFHAGIEK